MWPHTGVYTAEGNRPHEGVNSLSRPHRGAIEQEYIHHAHCKQLEASTESRGDGHKSIVFMKQEQQECVA